MWNEKKSMGTANIFPVYLMINIRHLISVCVSTFAKREETVEINQCEYFWKCNRRQTSEKSKHSNHVSLSFFLSLSKGQMSLLFPKVSPPTSTSIAWKLVFSRISMLSKNYGCYQNKTKFCPSLNFIKKLNGLQIPWW